MKTVPLAETLSGILALACATAVALATAFDAEARLGPAGPVATPQNAPSALVPVHPPSR